ncbi:uncharacterized protein LOC122966230 [Scomber scombrus]|uniref:Uncharacterized protein LOC122966230 n=1 Tax=Scomber scombrus TaxID=13677 RepID=A0AAV1Q789_SCOSC
MGNGPSEQEQIDRFVSDLSDGPDVRVNQNIVKFCSLHSSDMLKQHYERRMEAGDCAAGWIKDLVVKLAAFTSAPELAGLGALAIAVFIDILSSSPSKESVKDALRCVFAEEKASEVWDLIDECLKRIRMNIDNRHQLRSDLERIEHKLSEALTKLKNSMLRDNHMTTDALKAWVNGAAFHIHMLVHLVRLGGINTCNPVERLLSDYEEALDELFKKQKKIIENKCSLESSATIPAVVDPPPYFVDEMGTCYNIGYGDFDKHVEALYNHRYGRQKREIQQHFSDVRRNLQSLVSQRGSFNFQ